MTIVERLRDWQDYEPAKKFCTDMIGDALEAADEIERLRAENERLVAQVARDDEHYQAAMAMLEKHRKNWVEASQTLADIANSMKRDWIDSADHANWCVERAKGKLA